MAIAVAGAVAATSVPGHASAADDGPAPVPAHDGPLDTFSPVLQLLADQGEISVRSGNGDVVVASGQMSAGDFEIAEGVLEPGATYTYDATEVAGNSNVDVRYGIEYDSKNKQHYPTLEHFDPSGLVTPTIETRTVQDKASFSLATGQGRPAQETNGLYGRFWPLTEIPGLGASVNPNPGSKTVSTPLLDVADLLDDDLSNKIDLDWQRYEYYANSTLGGGKDYLLTNVKTQLQMIASAAGWTAAADAAAYNVEGRNVLPSFAMTLTSDQSYFGPDLFHLYTGGMEVITTAFARRSGFAYRLLGYLEVPESGTYSFSPYSPGGTRAYLYDHRDDDLGRIEISAPGEWNARTETCWAHGHEYSVANKVVHEERDQSGLNYTIHRTYEFADDDEEWYLPPASYIHQLELNLGQACRHPQYDHPNGQEVELEAGRRYPIDIAGWVGGVPGTIGMHVNKPDGKSTPLPTEWITPAPAGTIDFERTQHTSATLDPDVVASHVNGVGDELVTVTPDGDLVSHTRNGYGGWDTAGTYTDMVMPESQSRPPLQYDDMHFALDHRTEVEWTADPPAHPEQRSVSPSVSLDVAVADDASWTGEVTGPIEITLFDQTWGGNPGGGLPLPHRWARVTLDHLAVKGNGLDAEVESISGSIDGRLFNFDRRFSANIAPGSGTARFDETAETLIVDFALTGTQSIPPGQVNYNGERVELTLPLVGLESNLQLPDAVYPSTGLAVSEVGETLVAATAPLRGGDVALVTKADDRQPFSPDNTRDTTYLHDLYAATPEVDPPAWSVVSDLPQAVDVTADGNTATVVTPTAADRVRVDVVDRTSTSSQWRIIGSWYIATEPNTGHAAVPVAVGRDGSTRHLALATVHGVMVYTNTGTPFAWTNTQTLPNDGTVTGMDFDYLVDHLAIGQAGLGQVDLYERVAGKWTLKQTLRPGGDTNFGADVSFGYGLLAITDDADSLCTDHYLFGGCFGHEARASGSTYLYPDVHQNVPWGDLSEWMRLQHDGPGTHVTMSVGGSSVFPIVVGAVADGYGFDEAAPGRSNPGTFRSVF